MHKQQRPSRLRACSADAQVANSRQHRCSGQTAECTNGKRDIEETKHGENYVGENCGTSEAHDTANSARQISDWCAAHTILGDQRSPNALTSSYGENRTDTSEAASGADDFCERPLFIERTRVDKHTCSGNCATHRRIRAVSARKPKGNDLAGFPNVVDDKPNNPWQHYWGPQRGPRRISSVDSPRGDDQFAQSSQQAGLCGNSPGPGMCNARDRRTCCQSPSSDGRQAHSDSSLVPGNVVVDGSPTDGLLAPPAPGNEVRHEQQHTAPVGNVPGRQISGGPRGTIHNPYNPLHFGSTTTTGNNLGRQRHPDISQTAAERDSRSGDVRIKAFQPQTRGTVDPQRSVNRDGTERYPRCNTNEVLWSYQHPNVVPLFAVGSGPSPLTNRRSSSGDGIMPTMKHLHHREARLAAMRGESASPRPWSNPPPWPDEEDPTWPLYVPEVPTVDIHMIRTLAQQSKDESVLFGLRWLEDATLHVATDQIGAPSCRLSKDHWQQLMASHLIQEVPSEEVRSWAILTAVAEPSKRRHRMILDTLPQNVWSQRPPYTAITPVRHLQSKLAKCKFAICFDNRCWYFQLPPSPMVSSFWCIRRGNRWYRPRRGPMGHKTMVHIGHSITAMLCRYATADLVDCISDCIIDNTLIAAPDAETVFAAKTKFVEICERCNVSLGPFEQISHVVTHRGIVWDLSQGVFQLKQHLVAKTRGRIERVVKDMQLSRGQLESLAGSMSYVFATLGTTCSCYIYKLAAQYARKDPRTRIELTANVADELLVLHNELETHRRIEIHCPPPISQRILLVTDASRQPPFGGYGAIAVFPSGRQEQVSGQFDLTEVYQHTIATLELRAVELAILELDLHNCTVVLLSDNSNVVSVLTRGRTSAAALCAVLRRIKNLCQRNAVTLLPSWLPSKENRADPLSRGAGNVTALGNSEIRALLGWTSEELPAERKSL